MQNVLIEVALKRRIAVMSNAVRFQIMRYLLVAPHTDLQKEKK